MWCSGVVFRASWIDLGGGRVTRDVDKRVKLVGGSWDHGARGLEHGAWGHWTMYGYGYGYGWILTQTKKKL